MVSTPNRNTHLNAFTKGVQKSVKQKQETVADIIPYMVGAAGPTKINLEKIKVAGKGLFKAKPKFNNAEGHLLNRFAEAFDAHSKAIKDKNPDKYREHQARLAQDPHLKAHMLASFIEHTIGTQNHIGRDLLAKLQDQFVHIDGDNVTIKGGFGNTTEQPSVAPPADPKVEQEGQPLVATADKPEEKVITPPTEAEIEQVKREVSPDSVPGTNDADRGIGERSENAVKEDETSSQGNSQGPEPVVPHKAEGDNFIKMEEEAPNAPVPQPSPNSPVLPPTQEAPKPPVDPLKGTQAKAQPKAKVQPTVVSLEDIKGLQLEEENPRAYNVLDSVIDEHTKSNTPLTEEDYNAYINIFKNPQYGTTEEELAYIIQKLQLLLNSNSQEGAT